MPFLFEKSMLQVLKAPQDVLQSKLMQNIEKKHTMRSIVEEERLLKCSQYAWYSARCRFQKANHHYTINLINEKEYYSEKHKSYGFKRILSLLPNSLCIYSSPNSRGGVPNIVLLRRSIDSHIVAFKKLGDEQHRHELSELEMAHGQQRAIQMDKGYQGIAENICAIN